MQVSCSGALGGRGSSPRLPQYACAKNLAGFTSLLMIDDFPNRINLSGTFKYALLTACVAMPVQAV